MNSWYLVFAIAFVFFFLIPGAGAISVRRRWRRFRRSVIASSLVPTVTYARLAEWRSRDVSGLGPFRFFGRLEAIQDDDVIWLNDGTISVAADVERIVAYVLPAEGMHGDSPRTYAETTPDRVPWSRLTSLPERTPIFVSGPLSVEGGKPVFRSVAGEELLVILHDGPHEELLRHSIWTGRQRNEYWNALTPASLLVGALALLLSAYVLLRAPVDRAAALLSVSCALIPALPLVPPGFVTFPLYRRMWRRGRYLRAERDLLRLPARHAFDTNGEAVLPDGERYATRVVSPGEAEALVSRGAKRVSASVVDKPREYHAFGALEAGQSELRRPADPMSEFAVLPGPPPALAHQCQRYAQLFEAGALAALAAGMGVNFYLALYLISRFVF